MQSSRDTAHLHYRWHLSIPGHTDRCKSWRHLYTCLRSDTGCSHTRLCLKRIKFLTVKLTHEMLMPTDTSMKTTTQNSTRTKVVMETQRSETRHVRKWIIYCPFSTCLYPYLSDTVGLYNQVHTDTGSRWPDLYRYRRSDRGHWHTRLCL